MSLQARTALIKNKARQIIRELAPTNPVYYEKLRERLERIREQEEKRRKESAVYFNQYATIYKEALNEEEERRKWDPTPFEFAIYEQLESIKKNQRLLKNTTEKIFEKVSEETSSIVGRQTKLRKKMSIGIYDILMESKYPKNKIEDITQMNIDLC